jgi:hypothetical protein
MRRLTEEEKEQINQVAQKELLRLMASFYNLPKDVLKYYLMQYQDTHGENAIIAMWGWTLFCEKHEDASKMLWPTISHDLNGRNDDKMLPRSSDYAPIAVEHFLETYLEEK